MKLRLELRRSSEGSSNPVTGGFSGFSTGAVWPKAGAGVVSGVESGGVCGLLCAAIPRLMPETSSANRIICFVDMIFTRAIPRRDNCPFTVR